MSQPEAAHYLGIALTRVGMLIANASPDTGRRPGRAGRSDNRQRRGREDLASGRVNPCESHPPPEGHNQLVLIDDPQVLTIAPGL
ncbi:DNA-binding protein [Streptomyces sp. SID7813]|jgi:hypothetical protein|uniref:DNA-binding protein n=1 Tax=Streptomyces coelicolor (strain ATCC BAA-471 / A3(2) / M145) TaxID=100226 RepID=Q9S1X4_STRCO|nr:DNA-binding protein [Streptomyces sp. SID7813]QFI40361.1 DNA-binding protein [Streptomyces coelicolor A3(2)]MYU47318.1 DNA-binding protein [Streptomyces sp. SID7813]QFI47520.1 DNA-binding protein [Streptomyces coelicolor A3(2)]CAB53310.1 hypothetical protein [Streptomyces coelicolor A3(2)]